ncbi:MAG TPA: hypothetical protein VGD10_09665 [Allosphingosinicella sp.]
MPLFVISTGNDEEPITGREILAHVTVSVRQAFIARRQYHDDSGCSGPRNRAHKFSVAVSVCYREINHPSTLLARDIDGASYVIIIG